MKPFARLDHTFCMIDPTSVDLEPTTQACRWCGISNEGDMLAVEGECAVRLRASIDSLWALVNTPHEHEFHEAVMIEAAHQQLRWGSAHDDGKEPSD